MNELEIKVREGLVNQRAEDLMEVLQDPEYGEKVRHLAVKIVQGMYSAIMDQEEGILAPTDEERDETMALIEKSITDRFCDKESLRKQAFDSAKGQILTTVELQAQIQSVYDDMDEREYGAEALAEFKALNDNVIRHAEYTDNLIVGLAKIAEEKGIEKALKRESHYQVIRQMYPTAEEYIEQCKEGMLLMREYFKKVESIMIKDGEAGKAIGAAFGSMGDTMAEFREMMEEAQITQIQKMAEKIYN